MPEYLGLPAYASNASAYVCQVEGSSLAALRPVPASARMVVGSGVGSAGILHLARWGAICHLHPELFKLPLRGRRGLEVVAGPRALQHHEPGCRAFLRLSSGLLDFVFFVHLDSPFFATSEN